MLQTKIVKELFTDFILQWGNRRISLHLEFSIVLSDFSIDLVVVLYQDAATAECRCHTISAAGACNAIFISDMRPLKPKRYPWTEGENTALELISGARE
jgi:hypothetical protein